MKNECSWMNFIHDDVSDDVANDVDDDARHDDIYVIHDTIHNIFS